MSRIKRKLVRGVGVNDADYQVTSMGRTCLFYSRWQCMMKRCYSSKYQKENPSYIGCSVCKEWLTFSVFKAWMESQDWQGKFLDKDILIQGNKVYSPGACIFISLSINNLILSRKALRGKLPQGVCFDKSYKKFRAQCSVDNEKIVIGYFDSPSEAFDAYREYKYSVIKGVADSVGEPLKSALLRFKIEP